RRHRPRRGAERPTRRRQPDDRPHPETPAPDGYPARNCDRYDFEWLGRFEEAEALGSFRTVNSFSRPTANRRQPTGEPGWLTSGQAAKFLGVAQSTIRKWSDQGRAPAFYPPGGPRRYRRRDLELFVDRSGPSGRPGGPLVLVVDDDARLREYMRVNL